MIIALAILLAAGAKEFAIVNKLFTGMVFPGMILISYPLYLKNHEKALI